MTDETPRFDLSTYEQGDTDWDHTDTVEALDKTAIDRGPIEDRPSEGSYDDELYHAVDQRITWRWDDDHEDWEAINGLGSPHDPVPGTTHLEAVDAAEVESDSTAAGALSFDSLEAWDMHHGEDLGPNGTAERQFDHTYQNGNNYTIQPIIEIAMHRFDGDDAFVRLLVSEEESPDTEHTVDMFRVRDVSTSSNGDRQIVSAPMGVPPGYYYELTEEFANSAEIQAWKEIRVGGPGN